MFYTIQRSLFLSLATDEKNKTVFLCQTGKAVATGTPVDLDQGCQIFFIAYGQNADKNGQNGCLLKKFSQNCKFICGNFYIHRGLKLFGRQYIFCQKNLVLPKKQVLSLKQQVLP